MQCLGGEIRPQVAAMPPDRAVVHETVLEEHLLTGRNILGSENGASFRLDRLCRAGRCLPISAHRHPDENCKPKHHDNQNSACPPRRETFNGLHIGRRHGPGPPYVSHSNWNATLPLIAALAPVLRALAAKNSRAKLAYLPTLTV